MSWKLILKIQELVPKEEEVEIELDMGALAESCCEQAKLSFIQLMMETHEAHPLPDNDQLIDVLLDEGHNITCDEYRTLMQDMTQRPAHGPIIRGLQRGLQQILEEWEECEGGE